MHKLKFFLCFLFLFSSLFSEEICVLGIGSPCLDYILRVDEPYLQELSLKKGDWLEMNWTEFSSLLKKTDEPLIFTGGGAPNTIKGLANLGISCSLIGNVGSDFTGDMIMHIFKNLGVKPFFSRKNLKSSQILCLVTPDGERTFCSYVLPEKGLTEESLRPEYFKGITLVHLDGYSLKNGVLVEKAFKMAKEAKAHVSFDLAHDYLAEKYRERLLGTISKYVDILFVNEVESFALTELPPKEAALFLKNFCQIVVVKVGEKGCFVASDKGIFHFPANDASPVDSTGAGDLFASGFLYGYLKGYSIETSAQFGNLAGSTVIESYGAEIPASRLPELQEKFEQIRCKQSFSPL